LVCILELLAQRQFASAGCHAHFKRPFFRRFNIHVEFKQNYIFVGYSKNDVSSDA